MGYKQSALRKGERGLEEVLQPPEQGSLLVTPPSWRRRKDCFHRGQPAMYIALRAEAPAP
jgi:hypothetical protein